LLWLFQKWSLMYYLPGLASNLDPPISASQIARITGMSHWCPAEALHLKYKRTSTKAILMVHSKAPSYIWKIVYNKNLLYN
jgi:hypothetical protein